MSANSENGVATILANFEKVGAYCNGYGPSYQPIKESIQLHNLQQLLMEGRASLATVIDRITAFNTMKNARIRAFEDIDTYITRVYNALSVSNASEKLIQDAQGIVRKIKGLRAGKKEEKEIDPAAGLTNLADTDDNDTSASPKNEDSKVTKSKKKSAAQTSRNELIEHIAKFIALLQSEMTYHPNEEDLQIAAIQQRLEMMRITNSSFLTYEVELSNARIFRDDLLYRDKTGICAVALDVKKYVKAVYGATSVQYKQISSLKFPRRK